MKNIFWIISISVLLFSCEKEKIELSDLNITTTPFNHEITITGFVSTENVPCEIKITQPVSIQDSVKIIPINDAVLRLTGGGEMYFFQLADQEGIYISDEKIQGEEGQVFTLEVIYNGKTYTASDKIPTSTIDFKFPVFEKQIFEEDNFVSCGILKHNFGFETPARWTFVEGNVNPDGLFKIPFLSVNELSKFQIYTHQGSIPQGIFPSSFSQTGASGQATDSLEIIKMTLSDEYYAYLLSVFNVTDWHSGIFSTIEGNVKTNISDGGFGYFYGLNVSRKRVTYQEL